MEVLLKNVSNKFLDIQLDIWNVRLLSGLEKRYIRMCKRQIKNLKEEILRRKGLKPCKKSQFKDIYTMGLDVMVIRKYYGLMSQTELAKKMGISQAKISKVEAGNLWFSIQEMSQFAKMFNFTVEELVYE